MPIVYQWTYPQVVTLVCCILGVGVLAGIPLGCWIATIPVRVHRAGNMQPAPPDLEEVRDLLVEATGQLEQLTAEKLEELDAEHVRRDPDGSGGAAGALPGERERR